MKSHLINICRSKLTSTLVVATSLLCSFTSPAHSNSRNEARDAVLKLRQSTNQLKLQDEVASIETTFSVAEQYYKQSNYNLSEQYYMLTIQKARIFSSTHFAANPVSESIKSPSASAGIPLSTVTSSPAMRSLEVDTLIPTALSLSKSVDNKIVSAEPAPTEQQNTAFSLESSAESDEEQDDFLTDTVASAFMVGNPSIYTVVKDDTIRLISAKLGVTRQHLMSINNLNSKSVLMVGQQLRYNNRRIIPQQVKNGIIINIPEKTLYFFKGGKLSKSIPVALGLAANNKKFDWKTPTGKFRIVAKQKDPTWTVPPSIQEEMLDDGKEVITSVPPGPKNPLGKYAFKTTLPGILIHSTIKPASIYSFASHGCIRVYPEHMEDIFKEVKVNTQGEIIYRPVKLANTETGRIFLEVHHDVYGKNVEYTKVAKQLIEKRKLSDRVDWQKVKNVIRQKSGIAEDITL